MLLKFLCLNHKRNSNIRKGSVRIDIRLVLKFKAVPSYTVCYLIY